MDGKMNRREFLAKAAVGVAAVAAAPLLPGFSVPSEVWTLTLANFSNEYSFLTFPDGGRCGLAGRSCLDVAKFVGGYLRLAPHADLVVNTDGKGMAAYDFLKDQPDIAGRVFGTRRFRGPSA
jgi:hypothetical protein